MQEIKVVTVLNNYGEERYLIRFKVTGTYFFGLLKYSYWGHVSCEHSDDPFLYEDYNEAKKKAIYLFENSNPRRQRVIATLKEEVINDDK